MTISRSEQHPRRRLRWLVLVLGIVVLAVALVAGLTIRKRSFDTTKPADLASVRNLPVTFPDGHVGRLGEMIKAGRPTVINLWASWCGPCRREGPALADLQRRFAPDRLNIVALNIRDEAATPLEREAFLESVGLSPKAYAVLDTSRVGTLTNTADALVPRTLVFDAAGAPIGMITGYNPLAFDRIARIVDDQT